APAISLGSLTSQTRRSGRGLPLAPEPRVIDLCAALAPAWRDRIKPPGVERMASAKSADGQPQSAPGPVYPKRLDRVAAARGMDATDRGKERTDQTSVAADRQDQHPGQEGGPVACHGVGRSPAAGTFAGAASRGARVRRADRPRGRVTALSALSSWAASSSYPRSADPGLARTTSRLPAARESSRSRIR